MLRMHTVEASDDGAAILASDASVVRVEADAVRSVQAAPDDSEYPQQWYRALCWVD